MNCADVDSALNEHRVSSLGRAERKALDDHVRTCDRCAAALLADEMLRAEPPIDVPAGLLERVRRAVADAGSSSSAGAQAPAAGRPVFRPGRRGALWLGAAAAVALAAMLVVSPPQERETVSSTGSPDPIGMTLAGGQGASRFVEGQHYLRLPVEIGRAHV